MPPIDYLTKPPKIHPISKIITPVVVNYKSSQDIPVYEVRKKDCGVVLIELVFHAGRPVEAKKLVAASCASLLREGAGKYTSDVLSEEIDFMGATLSTSASMDYITIKAICLRKQLDKLIDIIGTIARSPHFEEKEWVLYKEKSIERLKVQLAKPDILSYRTITEEMYGSDHPYGYNSSPDLFEALDVSDLKAHHQKHIVSSTCQVFISGDISDGDRKSIDRLCSTILPGEKKSPVIHQVINKDVAPRQMFLKGGVNQASIRIGRKAFTRTHEDFDGLNYVCNVLGGYFGSRLVSALREDKGLTYGIYSTMDSHLYDGDFMISTEVANENLEECLEGIYGEMKILQEELVSEEELQLVNNYMMGNYLNLFDGPFNSIRAIKSLALTQIPLDELDTLIKSSLLFDAYQVRDMAVKYLDRNDFWEVIVGTLK